MRHRLQMSKKAQTGTQMVLRRQQTRLAVNMLWFSALLSKNSNYLFVPYPPPAQMLLSLSMLRAPSGLCARGAARACAGVRRRAGLLPACCTAGSICLPRMLVCHRPKTMVCWASLPAISPAGGKRCRVGLTLRGSARMDKSWTVTPVRAEVQSNKSLTSFSLCCLLWWSGGCEQWLVLLKAT